MKYLKSVFCALFLLFIGSMASFVFASDAGSASTGDSDGEPSCWARIVLVGNFRCGKTSIWKRIFGDGFDEREGASDMMVCRNAKRTLSDGRVVQFNIWDTAGAELYYEHVLDFVGKYKGTDPKKSKKKNSRISPVDANFVIIVHDLSSQYTDGSKAYLDQLVKDVKDRMRADGKLILVGSKSDKAKKESPVNFSDQKALLEQLAHVLECRMYITSASDSLEAPRFAVKLLSYIKKSCEEMELYSSNPESTAPQKFPIKKFIDCIIL